MYSKMYSRSRRSHSRVELPTFGVQKSARNLSCFRWFAQPHCQVIQPAGVAKKSRCRKEGTRRSTVAKKKKKRNGPWRFFYLLFFCLHRVKHRGRGKVKQNVHCKEANYQGEPCDEAHYQLSVLMPALLEGRQGSTTTLDLGGVG